MVFSYVRMRCSVDEAMARYGRWIGLPEIVPPRLVPERDKIDLALSEGNWIGLAVYVYASGPWAVVEEISGGLDERSAEDWLTLAEGGDLIFACYNDAISYALIVVVENGRLVRHCLRDEEEPSANLDVGQLPEETERPLVDWTDLVEWVENDEEKLGRSEQGWLWIHQAP
jgi:hypothetical protein